MIKVIALTQFAFLSLGIVALKIMLQANATSSIPAYLQTLNQWALWLFAVPIVWIAFASLCSHLEKGPLSSRVAQAMGILLAVLCFLFLATVTFLPR
jgi:hypothetical protein